MKYLIYSTVIYMTGEKLRENGSNLKTMYRPDIEREISDIFNLTTFMFIKHNFSKRQAARPETQFCCMTPINPGAYRSCCFLEITIFLLNVL